MSIHDDINILRILHISDLHFSHASYNNLRGSKFLSFRFPPNFKSFRDAFFKPASRKLAIAVAQATYELREQLDAVLITGDLATFGDLKDLELAREYIASMPTSLWYNEDDNPTLQSVSPILLMPGNHDRYAQHLGFPKGVPGGLTFDSVFDKYWTGGQGVFSRPVKDLLWVVACDLSLSAGDNAFWGNGRAYPRRLSILEGETLRLRRAHPNMAIIWAVHFPPKFDNISPQLELLDDDLLIEKAERANIEYILCGHTHRSAFYYLPTKRRIAVHCAGSATQLGEEQNSMHVLEISLTGTKIVNFSHRALVYSNVRRAFT